MARRKKKRHRLTRDHAPKRWLHSVDVLHSPVAAPPCARRACVRAAGGHGRPPRRRAGARRLRTPCRVLRADCRAFLAQAEAAARHIPKRARRDKNCEAVFDEKARRCAARRSVGATGGAEGGLRGRRDFLTGFHKRKKQRRKARSAAACVSRRSRLTRAQVAEHQLVQKARQSRVEARKQARVRGVRGRRIASADGPLRPAAPRGAKAAHHAARRGACPQLSVGGACADLLSQAEEEDDEAGGGAVPTTAVSYPGVTVTIAPLDAGDEPPRRGAGRTSLKKR